MNHRQEQHQAGVLAALTDFYKGRGSKVGPRRDRASCAVLGHARAALGGSLR